jgi:hypothetical protein
MLKTSVILLLTAFVVLIYSVSANPSGSGSGNYWEHQSTPALGRARIRRTSSNNEETHVSTPALRNFRSSSGIRRNNAADPVSDEVSSFNRLSLGPSQRTDTSEDDLALSLSSSTPRRRRATSSRRQQQDDVQQVPFDQHQNLMQYGH